jgi:hypothetical protein
LIRSSHGLHNLFRLGFRYAPLLRDYLGEECVDFSCHVSSVTADIEVRLLLKELVELFREFFNLVLNVNLLWTFSGESNM